MIAVASVHTLGTLDIRLDGMVSDVFQKAIAVRSMGFDRADRMKRERVLGSKVRGIGKAAL